MKQSLESSLQWLGSRRDAFIVVGGLIYASGFVAWGVVSVFNFGYGLTEANYAQYFVGGIVPFLIVSFILLTLIKGPSGVLNFASNINNKNRNSVGYGLLFISIAVISLMLILRETLKSQDMLYIFIPIYFVCFAIIFVGFLVLVGADVKEDPAKRWPKFYNCMILFQKFLIHIYLMLSIISSILFALFLLLFAFILIQKLPQGLGGIKSRCVVFDLLKEGISEKTAAALSDNEEAAIADQKIIRTDKVDLLFSGTSEYIIKHEDKTYQIAKNLVSIVAQCD